MNENLELILIILTCIIVGFFMGHALVYVFNKIPDSWLCDYGERPNEKLAKSKGQRIKGFPWKYLFSATFIVFSLYMGIKDPKYAVAGIVAIWALGEIAIADFKYMIIPDQFLFLLGITAVGFVPYNGGFLNILLGALTGGGIMLVVGALGKVAFKKESLGFGDVKLCAVIGLCLGFRGSIYIILISSLASGIFAAIKLIRKKAREEDMQPMAPFISSAAIIYILFFMV